MVYNRTFYYDNDQKPKEDFYQELQIVNNGINIRKVSDSFAGDFYRISYSPTLKAWTKYTYKLPQSIIFHDPFDLTDFTAVGGTWASTDGYSGTRRNDDPTVTVKDILPNRYYAAFTDGNSKGTLGMNIYWDVTALSTGAEGTAGKSEYLKGYVGNAIYSQIAVQVEPFVVDIASAKAQIIKNISDTVIDPYDFNAEEFVAGLPNVFVYDYVSGEGSEQRNKTYIFNELVWSLDYKVIDEIKRYVSLTYDDAEFEPYIDLRFRSYSEDAEGNKADSNTAWTSVRIPLKVLNYKVRGVTSAVSGTVGGIVTNDELLAQGYQGMVTFNPLNNRDPYTTLENVKSFDAVTIEHETSKDVHAVINNWDIIDGSFETVALDGKDLKDYDSNSSGEQYYVVRYKVTDGTGYVQTVKLLVRILSSTVLPGASYFIDESGDVVKIEDEQVVYPYAAIELSASATFEDTAAYAKALADYRSDDVVERMHLASTLYVVYEGGYSERVSLGNYEVKRRVYVQSKQNADGTSSYTEYELKAATVVVGEEFSYVIPYMDYATDETVTVYAVIGKHGYARWEMEDLVTERMLSNLSLLYSENRAKASAYDKLYASLGALDRLTLVNILKANNGSKARAWDAWYARFANKDSDLYGENDVLKMDLMLLEAKLSYCTLTYEAALMSAYEKLLSDNNESDESKNKISATELRELADAIRAKNQAWLTRAVQASAVMTWYDKYSRKQIEIPRKIDARIAVTTNGTRLDPDATLSEDNYRDKLAASLEVGYKGYVDLNNNYVMIGTDVTWIVDVDDLMEAMSYNGAVVSARVVLRDNLFGNQTLQTSISVAQLNIEGLMLYSGSNFSINAYDESTIDELLKQYYYTDVRPNGGNGAYRFGLILKGRNAEVVMPYTQDDEGRFTADGFNGASWELATDPNAVYDDVQAMIDSTYSPNSKISANKVLWSYLYDTDGDNDPATDGLSYYKDASSGVHKIVVYVQSKNYDASSSAARWQYPVTLDLAHFVKYSATGQTTTANLCMETTVAEIVGAEVDGDAVSVEKNETDGKYVFAIDPAQVKLDDGVRLTVRFYNDVNLGTVNASPYVIDAKVDFGGSNDFFNKRTSTAYLVLGDKTNNEQRIEITLLNTAIRRVYEISEVVYKASSGRVIDMNGTVAYALDDITAVLPSRATVEFTENGAVSYQDLPVKWRDIEPYGADGLTEDGNKPTALAVIGDATFGYVYRTLTLNVEGETITSYPAEDIPDEIKIDPYGENNLDWLATHFATARINTTGRSSREVTVKVYTEDVDVDAYAGKENNFAEMSFNVRFGLGYTIEEGLGGAFEARQNVLVKVTLQDRRITGLYRRSGETGAYEPITLTGDAYDQIVFYAYERSTKTYKRTTVSGKSRYAESNDSVSGNFFADGSPVYYKLAGGTMYVLKSEASTAVEYEGGNVIATYKKTERVEKTYVESTVATNGNVFIDGDDVYYKVAGQNVYVKASDALEKYYVESTLGTNATDENLFTDGSAIYYKVAGEERYVKKSDASSSEEYQIATSTGSVARYKGYDYQISTKTGFVATYKGNETAVATTYTKSYEIVGGNTFADGSDVYYKITGVDSYIKKSDAVSSPTYEIHYGSGAIQYVTEVTWEEINNVEYTVSGGVYTVYAVVGGGAFAQRVPVTVNVDRTRVVDLKVIDEYTLDSAPIETDENGVVTRLVIEPFEGFVDLPERITAVINNGKTLVEKEVFVEWDGSLVTADMTLKGGNYEKGSSGAVAYAILYVVDTYGNRVGEQRVEVSVYVPDRSILGYSVSYNGVDYVPLDQLIYRPGYNGGETEYYEFLLNPYTMQNPLANLYANEKDVDRAKFNAPSRAYSDKFMTADKEGNEIVNPDFSFFRTIKVLCQGDYEREYVLTVDNYFGIGKFVQEKSYKGYTKDIEVDLRVGEDVNRATESDGTPKVLTCAADAYSLQVAPFVNAFDEKGNRVFDKNLKVHFLDMSYDAGLEKNIYYVDRYGVIRDTRFTETIYSVEKEPETFVNNSKATLKATEKTLSFVDKVEYPTETLRDVTVMGKDSEKYYLETEGKKFGLATYTFEEVSYDGSGINRNWFSLDSVDGATGEVEVTELRRAGSYIDYNGGVGRLLVKFGSEKDNKYVGQQTYSIPIVYADRKIKDVDFGVSAPNYKLVNWASGAVGNGFVFDPFIVYNNSTEGFDSVQQGFLKAGQYGVTLIFGVDVIDNVFNNKSGSTFRYSLTSDQKDVRIGMTFDDKDVVWRYTGGEFEVRAVVGTGTAKQEIPYMVKMLSRRVDVDRPGTVYGFGSTILKTGVTTDTTAKVYDLIGEVNVEAKLLNSLFNTSNSNVFAVYFEDFDEPLYYTMNHQAASTGRFYLTNEEKDYYDEEGNLVKNGLTMSFMMDTANAISYKGGTLKFSMTIPGYGMGVNGEQKASVSFNMAEQYVAYVKAVNDSGSEIEFSEWFADDIAADAIKYDTTEHKWYITSPYYYIQQGGVPMPDYVYAYVTDKETWLGYKALIAQGADVSEATIAEYVSSHSFTGYKTRVNWTGGSYGRLTVYFDDESRFTSMMMPIDDQTYKFDFKIQPWKFGDTSDEVLGFQSTIKYGPDDIILLPTSTLLTKTNNPDFYIEIICNEEDGHYIFDSSYTYILHYKINGVEKTVTVSDITGGGSYRNNYNKWYFGSVKFGYADQYATITLGGKGGQTFRWRFTQTSTRVWINSNVPSMIAIDVGAEYNLPKNLIQSFGSDTSYALSETETGYYIPIEYYDLQKPVNSNKYNHVISADLDAKKVEAQRTSPTHVQNQDFGKDEDDLQILNEYQIALLNWRATGRRAYPSPDKVIGGRIILSGYGSVVPYYVEETDRGMLASLLYEDGNVGLQRIYLSDVDSSRHYLYAPNTDKEVEDLPAAYENSKVSLDSGYRYDGLLETTDNYFVDMESGDYISSGNVVSSRIPTLYIQRGTMFRTHNLPLMSLNMTFPVKTTNKLLAGIGKVLPFVDGDSYARYGYSSVTYIPWQNAKVYADVGNNFTLKSNGEVWRSGRQLNALEGFYKINTNANVGTSYLIVTTFSLTLATDTDAEHIYDSRPTTDTQTPSNYKAQTFVVATKIEISNR